jgi:glucose/mannose-6-phosphate isomerase
VILDTVGMFDAAAAFPEQIARALDVSERTIESAQLPDHDSVANVVLLGAGASGLAARFVLEAVGPTISVPVVVHRGYGVPNFVDSSTLVVAISFDGETSETLEAAQDAFADDAMVVCVSNGGALQDWAEGNGLVHFPVMADAPVDRAALASLSVPVLLLLERIGMYPGAGEWIRSAVLQATRRRNELITEENFARRLSRRLGRSLPIVYGGNGLGGFAAEFWKSQFNLNAKVASFANQVPELTHDEIAGWGQDGDVTRQVFHAFLLRHEFEHPQVSQRLDVVEEVLVEVVGSVHVVQAEGDGLLAQLFDLVLIGQFLTLHSAVEQGIDPGPVPIVTEIASRVGDA